MRRLATISLVLSLYRLQSFLHNCLKFLISSIPSPHIWAKKCKKVGNAVKFLPKENTTEKPTHDWNRSTFTNNQPICFGHHNAKTLGYRRFSDVGNGWAHNDAGHITVDRRRRKLSYNPKIIQHENRLVATDGHVCSHMVRRCRRHIPVSWRWNGRHQSG